MNLTDIIGLMLGVLGALGGVTIVQQYILKEFAEKRKRKSLFGSEGNLNFTAYGSTTGNMNIRIEESIALQLVKRASDNKKSPDNVSPINSQPGFDELMKTDNLVLVGSPRYNRLADDLQMEIDMPFQFVQLDIGETRKETRLAIQDSTGVLYVSSADPNDAEMERIKKMHQKNEVVNSPMLSKNEFDYGIVLVGNYYATNSKIAHRVIWFGGIHAEGTYGCAKWISENIANYDWEQAGNKCFLLKINYDCEIGGSNSRAETNKPHYQQMYKSVELLKGPAVWEKYKVQNNKLGLLFDLGNVLLPFDRNRFDLALRNYIGISIESSILKEIEGKRLKYENGEIDTDAFFDYLSKKIAIENTSLDLLKAAWCDIFAQHQAMVMFIELISKKLGDNVKFILISNTDPIRLSYALKEFGLGRIFQEGKNVVASYQAGLEPKGNRTSSMFDKAVDIVKKGWEKENIAVLFIDDIRDYFDMPDQGNSFYQIHYRTFGKFCFDLRKHGVYITMAETVTPG